MKKILSLVLSLFFFLEISAQSSSEVGGLLEIFGGKYRSAILNASGTRSIGCNSILTVRYGDVVYTLLGHEYGDEFQIMAVRGTEVIMRQCFYMNGEIDREQSGVGDWFADGTLKLRAFLQDIFSISIGKKH